MLNTAYVVPYLLSRGLLTPDAVVDGELVVRDISRRNRNHEVRSSTGPSYVLKQGVSEDSRAGVHRESRIYDALTSSNSRAGRFLPRSFGYDASQGVLAIELLPQCVDLRRYHARGRFPRGVAAAMGRALAAVHGATDALSTFSDAVAAEPPWVLSLHLPPTSVLGDASAANLEMLRAVQRHQEFGCCLDELRAGWQPRAPSHHDPRWDNWLVRPDVSRKVWLIDWEFARAGEPWWDIGACFAEHLQCWLDSMPLDESVASEHLPSLARIPLERMQPAMSALWQAYAKAAGLDRETATTGLMRSTSYCGARLLELTYQRLQGAEHMDGHSSLALQLAFNILTRPDEAGPSLFGIAQPSRI